MALQPTGTKLGPKLRKALVALVAHGGVNPRSKKPAVAIPLLEALGELGLAHLTTGQRCMVWRATDTGRGWVAATGLRPVFLAQRSEDGYTRSRTMAMPGEPETMDRGSLPYSERPAA